MSRPPAPTSSDPTALCYHAVSETMSGHQIWDSLVNVLPDGSCPQGYLTGAQVASAQTRPNGDVYVPGWGIIPKGIRQAAQGAANDAGQAVNKVQDQLANVTSWGDGLTKIFQHLLSPDFWKGIGLLATAAGLLVVGVVIWFRKDLEAGAVAAA